MLFEKFSTSLITLTIVGALSGCAFEGDDGKDGINGANGQDGVAGQTGTNGSDGLNAPTSLNATLIGRSVLNVESPEGAAEIVAYQKSKNWIYAINSSGDNATVEIIDANTIDAKVLIPNAEGIITNTNMTPVITVDVSANTAGDANSIAISNSNELLAVAMAADTVDENGHIAFYDISGAQPVFIKNVTVGVLPDMVTFSPDGKKVVVANEGEPSDDYTVDPEGSISVINVTDGEPADTGTQINFQSYNDKQELLESQGAKFSNPTGRTINGVTINTTVAMDLEPEYVAISEDSQTAYISIQENNALAIVDLFDNSVNVIGLGFKDWSQYKLDASDKDDGIHLRSYNGLYGMYQPDTTVSYSWKGANFIVTANEGDGREYFFDAADESACLSAGGTDWDDDDGCLAYTDEIRASKLTLGPVFDSINNDNSDLGRLKVTTTLGDADGDGIYEALYTYGARSFTIWDENGLVVFDSGDEIARITASVHGQAFNNDEDENEGDTRSDAKGAEPEALILGKINDQTYAFIGLERMGGILAYNITNPHNVTFVDYFYNRGTAEGADITGDLAPEGMTFVPAEDSPNGKAMLIVGNEISGSVAVWQIEAQ